MTRRLKALIFDSIYDKAGRKGVIVYIRVFEGYGHPADNSSA